METIILTLNSGIKKEYVKGIKFKEVLKNLKEEMPNDIIFAKYNNKLINLEDEITKNGNLSLYDLNTSEGNKTYERGLLFLFENCALEVLGPSTKIYIKYSIDKGIFCKIDRPVSTEEVSKIKKLMKDKVKDALPFTRLETTKEEMQAGGKPAFVLEEI